METSYIINRLKSTPYKFTELERVRDRIKKLPDDDRISLINNIRQQLNHYISSDIGRPLQELVRSFDILSARKNN
ncbi:MAG TPA: hypothetical protein VGB43_04680 [Flavobacterium sp.]